MLYSPTRFIVLRLLCVGVFALASRCLLPAADAPIVSNTLTIAQGRIASMDGRDSPATLRNLANLLMRRYSAVTINIVNVDEVVLDRLTLRMPSSGGRDQQDAAVNAVLTALVEATDNRAFSVSHLGENQFLLARPRSELARATRNVEVFNLKLYLEGPGERAMLEADLHERELQLELIESQRDRIKAAVSTGSMSTEELKVVESQRAQAKERMQLAAKQLLRAQPNKEETARRLDQLFQVVQSTLAKLDPDEKVPEFEYHAGTHLLIVIGSDPAIAVTRKVVTALEKSSD